MVIRRKPKKAVKPEAKSGSSASKAKGNPSHSKGEDNDLSEDREIADQDGAQLNADVDASKLNAAENENNGTSNEEVMEINQVENDEEIADLEDRSLDGEQNTDVVDTVMQEAPGDSIEELRGTTADEDESAVDEFLNFEDDDVEETVKYGETIVNEHEERKETKKKLENGEEESANELSSADVNGNLAVTDKKTEVSKAVKCDTTADTESSHKVVSVVRSEEKRSLVKGETDGLTNVAGPSMTEEVTGAESSEQVEAGEAHAGSSKGDLSAEKKDASLSGDGNGLEQNSRKKVKRIVKRLVKRKVLVNPFKTVQQSSVGPGDAEQEKEKASSADNRTKKVVKKVVVNQKASASQATVEPPSSEVPEDAKSKEEEAVNCEAKSTVEPSSSEVPENAKSNEEDIVNCEAKPEGKPSEVNEGKNTRRKKKVVRKKVVQKKGVLVTGEDEIKLRGKDKAVIKNENLNNTKDPKPTNGGKNAGTRVGENAEGSKGKSPKKDQSPKKVESQGMIFMCTSKTKKDCFRYKVLGLPSGKKEMVKKVYKGMRLFLFDVDSRLMHGVYKAADRGGYNLEPRAFNSSFPSQVRFTIMNRCEPLPEEKFKQAIKDNYFTKNKFSCVLTSEQVKNLCKLFQDSRVPKPTGASGSLQPQVTAPRTDAKSGKKVTRVTEGARVEDGVRREHSESSKVQEASRQGRKRDRDEEMREDRKRRRDRDDDKRERDRRRTDARTNPRHSHRPLPISRNDYRHLPAGYENRHPAVYERRGYSPPLAFVDPLPPPREVSPPSYTYGRTSSMVDGYRRDHVHDHHPHQGLAYAPGGGLEYRGRDPYPSYRDPVAAYVDPYVGGGGRGHHDPYYPSSSSRQAYISPREDYLQSTVPSSSERRVPLPPHRRY